MNQRSKWACNFSLRILVKEGWAYLWTLTTPDGVDLKELSRRWRKLICNGFTPCVRVFEWHPGGHGYHIHFVTALRIDVETLRPKAEAAGFGRIHVRRLPGKKATYVAKYLTKYRSNSPGVRLWACVGFQGVKIKDVIIENEEWEEIKMVMKQYPAPAGYDFYAKRDQAVKRHQWLLWEALKKDDEPNFKPTFPALFRRWKENPYCTIGKSAAWWAIATTQSMGAAAHLVEKGRHKATQSDKSQPSVDSTLPLPLEYAP